MEKEIFDEFYTKTFKKNLRWLCRTYRNLKDPEDFLQETYTNFYIKYYFKWDSTKSSLITYFTNYLRMTLKENLVSANRKPLVHSLDNIIYGEDGSTMSFNDVVACDEPYDNGYVSDKMEIVKDIVRNLEGKDQTNYKMLLMHNSGLKYSEIGINLDLNVSTVKSRIRNIRTVINKEYSKIIGIETVFDKKGLIKKNRTLYIRKKINKIIDKSLS